MIIIFINKNILTYIIYTPNLIGGIPLGHHGGICLITASIACEAAIRVSHEELYKYTDIRSNKDSSLWGCSFTTCPSWFAAAFLVTELLPVSNNIKSLSNL